MSNLEDKIENNTQSEQQNEKRLKKNEDSLRELQDMKWNNICIIGCIRRRRNGIDIERYRKPV